MSSYSDQDLSSAVDHAKNGTPVREVARIYNIPRSTIKSRLSSYTARQIASQERQRLSPVQEEGLVKWILRQECLGYAPSHAQVHSMAAGLLRLQGDYSPLGKRWSTNFVKRHIAIKSKLGRRTEWARVNAATPAAFNEFFSLYNSLDWIDPQYRYNADEGGIIEGQGANGLVIGSSSQPGSNQVPVKCDTSRT
jgi:hypothetical protein